MGVRYVNECGTEKVYPILRDFDTKLLGYDKMSSSDGLRVLNRVDELLRESEVLNYSLTISASLTSLLKQILVIGLALIIIQAAYDDCFFVQCQFRILVWTNNGF